MYKCGRKSMVMIGGHKVAGKETSKYLQAPWKSPRYSLATEKEVISPCFLPSVVSLGYVKFEG
jgi:hypothetical protein